MILIYCNFEKKITKKIIAEGLLIPGLFINNFPLSRTI